MIFLGICGHCRAGIILHAAAVSATDTAHDTSVLLFPGVGMAVRSDSSQYTTCRISLVPRVQGNL